MGSAYIPAQNFSDQLIGTTSELNPVLLLEVDGVVYPNGYRISYPGGYRNFYPNVNSSGQVFISCHTIAYGEDLAAYTLPSNTKILVITATAGPVVVAQPSLGLGYDQIWQNVTGVRGFGLTYNNDTGNPIQVSIGVSTSGYGGGVNIAVNNQALSPTWSDTSGVTGSSSTVVVPPGATYLATPYGGATITSWVELRGYTATQTNSGFGINQTWQNVTASRAWGTPYTNNTGKPIQVLVAISTTSAVSGVGLVVDGITLPGNTVYSPSVTTSSPAYIIPPGSTYSSVLLGSGGSYAAWYELTGATVSGESTGIGYGQTWQDFSNIRSFNTTYTNTTNKPIQVVFNATTGYPGGGINLTVNGVALPPTYTHTSTMGTVSAVAVVPVGATYSATAYGSGTTYVSCFELRNTQYFTTSGTFTVPAGITSITIVACGGGGGGGGGSSRYYAGDYYFSGGAGGGRGELRSVTVAVTPGQVITFEVGAGGSQGSARDGPFAPNLGSDGTAGGTSRASLNGGATWVVVANGGQGGSRSIASSINSGAAGGSGGTGTVVVASQSGDSGVISTESGYDPDGNYITTIDVRGGGGAAGIKTFSGTTGNWGVGGKGEAAIIPYTLAVSGTGYGAGGSGGGVNYATNNVYYNGTDGRGGFVYIGY